MKRKAEMTQEEIEEDEEDSDDDDDDSHLTDSWFIEFILSSTINVACYNYYVVFFLFHFLTIGGPSSVCLFFSFWYSNELTQNTFRFSQESVR
jgi:hypothetical protein